MVEDIMTGGTSIGTTKLLDGEEENEVYVQYPWRWINVACLFLLIVTTVCLSMLFTPISTLLRDAYKTDDKIINSNATVFFIIITIFNVPSAYLLNQGET